MRSLGFRRRSLTVVAIVIFGVAIFTAVVSMTRPATVELPGDLVRVGVVVADVEAGDRVWPDAVTTVRVRLGGLPDLGVFANAERVTEMAEAGAVATRRLRPGEFVLAGDLLGIRAGGLRVVSFPVDPVRAATIRSGDIVDFVRFGPDGPEVVLEGLGVQSFSDGLMVLALRDEDLLPVLSLVRQDIWLVQSTGSGPYDP